MLVAGDLADLSSVYFFATDGGGFALFFFIDWAVTTESDFVRLGLYMDFWLRITTCFFSDVLDAEAVDVRCCECRLGAVGALLFFVGWKFFLELKPP